MMELLTCSTPEKKNSETALEKRPRLHCSVEYRFTRVETHKAVGVRRKLYQMRNELGVTAHGKAV